MEALPLELRLLILRNSTRALARALSCTALAAVDDSLARVCAELYPRKHWHCARAKHRDCVLCERLGAHPDAAARADLVRPERQRALGAALESITAFDADDDLLIVGLSRPSMMLALELHCTDGRQTRRGNRRWSHIELCDKAQHRCRGFLQTQAGDCGCAAGR